MRGTLADTDLKPCCHAIRGVFPELFPILAEHDGCCVKPGPRQPTRMPRVTPGPQLMLFSAPALDWSVSSSPRLSVPLPACGLLPGASTNVLGAEPRGTPELYGLHLEAMLVQGPGTLGCWNGRCLLVPTAAEARARARAGHLVLVHTAASVLTGNTPRITPL